jgi:transposase
MPIAVLGIDLGKNSCSVAGLDETGRVVLRRRVSRDGVVRLAAGLAPCVMAMEACCGAHHLGRVLRQQGHEVRLMSPEYVQPYVKAQKNDERDAEAIAEAATRPTMRFVELKSEEQLDGQVLHRARSRLVGERTALINQLRAMLLERGIVVAKGPRRLQDALKGMIDDGAEPPATLSPRIRLLIEDMRLEWRELDRRIAALSAEFVAQAREHQAARRLATIPGFGALNATALVAAIGRGETFRRARDLAAWLGLVPRQATTGGKTRLLGITKRGNTYLRTLLIHGARAALPSLSGSATPLGAWLRGLIGRAHRNKVVVALAGKLARMAWAVLRSGESYAAMAAGRPAMV